METKIKKWGNSLAVRIPKIIAEEMAVHAESPVEMELVEGRLVIRRLEEKDVTLAALLNEVTEKNRHAAIDTGSAAGDEAW